jgi:hypothetical protein
MVLPNSNDPTGYTPGSDGLSFLFTITYGYTQLARLWFLFAFFGQPGPEPT